MTAPVKFCSRCGEGVAVDTRYCASCGSDLSGGTGIDIEIPRTMEAELEEQLRKALAGDYDIGGLLGKGGMAYVYRAHEMMLDREVAIKVMPPDIALGDGMVERFKREAKTAAKLDHPNIIPIYRIGEMGRTVYFAMKYVVGRGLDEILNDQKTLPPVVVGAIIQHACSALAYAHRAGVIHRDIKPSNIMIDREGWVVVMDFGIAKAGGSSTLTATGAAIGTPHYMSPEQCSGSDVSPQSDQYALGIMTYQLLTGVLPIDGDNLPQILTRHFFHTPQPIEELVPDCPVRIRNAVMRALAKDAADRFPSVEEFAEEIASEGVGPATTRQLKTLGSASEIVHFPVPTSPIPAGKAPQPATDPDARTTPMPQQKTTPTDSSQSDIATTPMPAGRPEPAPTIMENVEAAAATPAPESVAVPKKKRGMTALLSTLGLGAAAVAAFFVLGGPTKFFPPGTASTATEQLATSTSSGGSEEAATTNQPGNLDPDVATTGGGPAANDQANLPGATEPDPGPPEVVVVPPPAAPTTGTFSLTGTPRGATVRLDGQPISDWTDITLQPGLHRVSISATGYDDFQRSFAVRAGGIALVNAGGMRLTPRPQVVAAPPPEPQHPSCSFSMQQARSSAIAAGAAAVMVRDCVPGLYPAIGRRGTRIENGLVPAGEAIRIRLKAEGYRTSPRIDTTLAVGGVLVLPGNLELRN